MDQSILAPMLPVISRGFLRHYIHVAMSYCKIDGTVFVLGGVRTSPEISQCGRLPQIQTDNYLPLTISMEADSRFFLIVPVPFCIQILSLVSKMTAQFIPKSAKIFQIFEGFYAELFVVFGCDPLFLSKHNVVSGLFIQGSFPSAVVKFTIIFDFFLLLVQLIGCIVLFQQKISCAWQIQDGSLLDSCPDFFWQFFSQVNQLRIDSILFLHFQSNFIQFRVGKPMLSHLSKGLRSNMQNTALPKSNGVS